jgi:hypothetical protein
MKKILGLAFTASILLGAFTGVSADVTQNKDQNNAKPDGVNGSLGFQYYLRYLPLHPCDFFGLDQWKECWESRPHSCDDNSAPGEEKQIPKVLD